MKFNPLTNELFTNKNEYLKRLECPFNLNWNELKENGTLSKKCAICENQVFDTELLSDNEIKRMLEENPKTCLSINPNQMNVEIISDGKNINIK
ncbi:hypothetical protein [Kordia sp.]|uniref:hypothetical protein n=1 Tax=Kordia sp. TaxID=1965332 RepID=UPI003D6B9252